MPKEKESDITELIKQVWESQVYLEADGLKQELKGIRIEFERRGTSGSGQHFSTEANAIASHLRKLIETCIDQIVDDKRGISVNLHDGSFWNQVAHILVRRFKQYLRGQIGALRNTAKLQGAGSGVEPQAFAEIIIEKLKEAETNVLDVAESSVGSTTPVAVPSEKEELNIDAGFCSPYFVTEQDEETCILNDAYILVYACIISDIKKLLPILESVAREDRPLLIFAEDVNGEPLATLIANNERGSIKSCAVGLGMGDKAQHYRWTISRFAGATIYGDEAGRLLDSATINGLGSVAKVISNQHRTQLFRDFSTSKPKSQYNP